MFSFNYCILGGRVSYLKIHQAQDGKPFACFSLQVNRAIQTGAPNLFVDVVAWEKVAETCAKLLRDGDIIMVEGMLTQSSFKTKTGQDAKKIKLRAQKLTMISREKENKQLKQDDREYHADSYQQNGYNLNSPVNPQQDVSQERNAHRYTKADAMPPSEDIAQEEPPLNDDYTPF